MLVMNLTFLKYPADYRCRVVTAQGLYKLMPEVCTHFSNTQKTCTHCY